MKENAAIVTTLVNSEKVIESFVNYHIQIGFKRIFLFFDDPLDTSIDKVKYLGAVTVIRNDDTLKARWLKTSQFLLFESKMELIDGEVMARQMLNMEVGCQMAREEGINWILHIDVDELFYSPHQSVSEHFADLTKRDIAYCQYMNYEGIPEKVLMEDFFKEVTLFRKNMSDFSLLQHIRYRARWQGRFFHYYQNGKMAAKICKIVGPGIHSFALDRSVKMNLWTTIQMTSHKFGSWLGIGGPLKKPVILHYPVCGFEHFWNKYITLGDFDGKWFGRYDVLPFHKAASCAVAQMDVEQARDFYEKKVMMDEESIASLLKGGLLIRLPAPVISCEN